MSSSSSSDTLQVIGAGWGRTGTMSLKTALEILGYGSCYHMVENINNNDNKFWIRVSDKLEYDFDEVFVRPELGKVYHSSCDYPASTYWKELLTRYPNAKVILTVRDPEKWYKSASETVYRTFPGFPTNSLALRVFLKSPLSKISNEFHMKAGVRDLFHGDMSKENIMKCYREHIERVKRECPPDKLLVYEVSQGWEPLCKFLGKPIPDVPFPRLNETAEINKLLNMFEMLGWAMIATMVALPVGVAWLAMKYKFFR